MTPLPTTLDGAIVLLGELIHDDRLVYGLATVAAFLLVVGVLGWLLLRLGRQR